MNEKIKIGIPKALLFYKYKDLWINFFNNLGCDVIISSNTNLETLEKGKLKLDDEACLSLKIFMGHVDYLIDKCDYILIPRIECLNRYEKTCTNFMALYDLVRNVFDVNFINYNINLENNEDEHKAFINMGLNLGLDYKRVEDAYNLAKKKEKIILEKKINEQNKLLTKSKKVKVLLAGHSYNLYDEFSSKPIIKLLKENDVDIIYSDIYDQNNLDYEVNKISKKNYWTFNREIMGSIIHYKESVDGIILITAFPCGPDSLSNEMILRKIKDKPIIQLIIDETTGEAGLATRIESFVDIIKERKRLNEKTNN